MDRDWVALTRDAVDLLARFAPDDLKDLRDAAPEELKDELERGGIAGDGDEFLLERSKVIFAAIQIFTVEVNSGSKAVAQKLGRSAQFRQVASIVSVIGSSSVVATASANVGASWVIVSGVLALASSLATVLADSFVKNPLKENESLFKVYEDLQPQYATACHLSREMAPYQKLTTLTKKQAKDLTKILEEAAAFLAVANQHRYVLESVCRVVKVRR